MTTGPAPFVPKLITILREGYSKKELMADLTAGVTVGIVALPLAIAFAIASGVKPEQGLYTAVIAGFLIAVLGGSRVQVSGPTGAFIVVVYGIVQEHGYEGLAVATLLAGFILIAMGMLRMGMMLKFIPYPLTVGFTTGIAVIIFSSQIKDLLGLNVEQLPGDFLEKWAVIAGNLSSFNGWALVVSLCSIAVIIFTPKVVKAVPGSLVSIVLMTVLVSLFNIPVETIGSRFGSVPSSLPAPELPALSWDLVQKMFGPAVTIALLGAIESLLSAVVSDGMIGGRHRSDMELVAQGIGNVVSPLFGGIPATGAIARTATNVKSGGRTPIAAIVHSFTLLVIMLCFGPLAARIPMPVLAAILVVVAYNMSEWRSFAGIFRSPGSDIAVLLVTFLLTVLIDLTVAIEVGIVLSALLFIRSMSNEANVVLITEEMRIARDEESEDPRPIAQRDVPSGVEVFEVHGPLFFGAVERFKHRITQNSSARKVLVIRMRNVRRIDATGLHAMEDVLERSRAQGQHILFSGLHEQPRNALERAGFIEKLGRDNICADVDRALERARTLLGKTA